MSDKRRAKLESLKDLSSEMSKLIGDKMSKSMKGMKKVTVASDSEEGLKEGLSKAQDIMAKKLGAGEMPQKDSIMGEKGEDKATKMTEVEDKVDSKEDIKSKIEELQKQLAEMEG